ncbi:hypothetical protein [Streptomyces galilaeus]|uniref:hypothetical protein n=1 Tax=Streptomyces galilaeus TaxID=33899 RepID=UPI0038F76AE8
MPGEQRSDRDLKNFALPEIGELREAAPGNDALLLDLGSGGLAGAAGGERGSCGDVSQ